MFADGLVVAGILGMVLAGAFGGAVAGLVIASVTGSQAVIALLAAIVGSLLALVVWYFIWAKRARLSPSSPAVLWNIVTASLVSALAGHELAVDIRSPPASPLIGATSGLLAAVLMASSLIAIVWTVNQSSKG